MGRNIQYPVDRVPTLDEYGTTKKEMEIGVDIANDESKSVTMLVDRDTLIKMYWNSIPKENKRMIKVRDEHD